MRPLDITAVVTARLVMLFARATTPREKAAILRRVARETNNGLMRVVCLDAVRRWRIEARAAE